MLLLLLTYLANIDSAVSEQSLVSSRIPQYSQAPNTRRLKGLHQLPRLAMMTLAVNYRNVCIALPGPNVSKKLATSWANQVANSSLYHCGLDQRDSRSIASYASETPFTNHRVSSQSFALPLMTSLNSFNPSTANATMFPSLSPPNPVSASFVDVSLSVATASATYPLQ